MQRLAYRAVDPEMHRAVAAKYADDSQYGVLYTGAREQLFAKQLAASVRCIGCHRDIGCKAHGARAERFAPDVAMAPDTPYGRSKLLGEQLLARSGVEHAVLRIVGIFGGNGPVHLGINRAIGEALHGQPPTLVGDGRARRNYVYVKDAAAAILAALERQLVGTHYLAAAEILSVREMLDAICDAFLPGARPATRDGTPAADQVAEPSAELPAGRAFHDALDDIRRTSLKCA